MSDIDWDSMYDVAKYVNEWARRTFPGRKPKASLTKLTMEEIPELLIHLKEKGTDGIGDELADCFILLLDLAYTWDVNLAKAISRKMLVNERRMWTKDEDLGHWNHATLKAKE